MSFLVISFLLERLISVCSDLTFIIRKKSGKIPSGQHPHLYMRHLPMSEPVITRMDEKQKNFWTGTGIGAVIIIITDLIIPLFGPFIGGFVAGYLARGDAMNAGRAGLIAGIVAGVVVSVVVFAGLASHWIASYAVVFGGFLLYIMITMYLAIMAFLGGAIAGAVRK